MGKAGAVRTNALDLSQLAAMAIHEYRQDLVATARVVRNTPALVYAPYASGYPDDGHVPSADEIDQKIEDLDPERHPSIPDACNRHLLGARRNKAAKKQCLHSIIQFPTDLPITPETERQILTEAVMFINDTFGGEAVFHARLDRDEVGQHAVDVFYAPKYLKKTKRKSEYWASLTKFGKALAESRFDPKPKRRKNQETGEWEPVFDADGASVMVPCNSQIYQGRALQDAFYEHLRDKMRLDWVVRGEKKVTRDPDRLEVEQYKLEQERKKMEAERIRYDQEIAAKEARLAQLQAAEAALADFEAWQAAELEKNIRATAEQQAASILFSDSLKWTALAILAAGDDVDLGNGEGAGGWHLQATFEDLKIPIPTTGLDDIRAVKHAILSADPHTRTLLDASLRRDPDGYAEWEETEDTLRKIGTTWRRVGTWSRELLDTISGAVAGLIKRAYNRLVDALVQDRKTEIQAKHPPPQAQPLTQMPKDTQRKIRKALKGKKTAGLDP